ncbi:MAG: CoA-binding protein [Thermoanaerobacteraceae bacterium]|nr:CoA-binding protein [Thermoanaerobacteraceae bacterium]
MDWHEIKTIAVVGLSDNPERASYRVAKYLQDQGYRIIPVNPTKDRVLGEKSYASLIDIPQDIKIDVVDVFRKPAVVPEIVEQTIARNVPVLWLQEGVVHNAAAEKARAAGIEVIMDKCMMKEHRKGVVS